MVSVIQSKPTADSVSAPSRGLLEILRCPSTGQTLEPSPQGMRSSTGAHDYPVVDGIPVLLSGRSLFRVGKVGPGRRTESMWGPLRAKLRRKATHNGVSRENFRRLAELLGSSPGRPGAARRVLIVGGGAIGFGVDELIRFPEIELVETDVYIGPRTRVVCDVHELPFADKSFDAVVLQAVLEHVIDPQRAVAEVSRVLVDGGLVYSEVPFMQQVHEGAYDFTRWTMTGHRALMKDFDDLESGAVGGAGEALAWSVRYFVWTLAGNARSLRLVLGAVALVITLPLRWLDRSLGGGAATLDAASGTFFLGRRRQGARPPREIIAAHRGAVRSPAR